MERNEYGQNVEDYIIDAADLTVHLDMSSKRFECEQGIENIVSIFQISKSERFFTETSNMPTLISSKIF